MNIGIDESIHQGSDHYLVRGFENSANYVYLYSGVKYRYIYPWISSLVYPKSYVRVLDIN